MVQKAKCYSTVTWCTPDKSHIERLTPSARFVYTDPSDISIHELFLVFIAVEAAIGSVLIQCILRKYCQTASMHGQGSNLIDQTWKESIREFNNSIFFNLWCFFFFYSLVFSFSQLCCQLCCKKFYFLKQFRNLCVFFFPTPALHWGEGWIIKTYYS